MQQDGPHNGGAETAGNSLHPDASRELQKSELDTVQARQYERIKLRVTLVNIGLSILAPFLFLQLGWSEELRDLVEGWTGSAALVVLLYVLIVTLAFEVFTFPLDVYSGHIVEHRFGFRVRQHLFQGRTNNIHMVLA